MLKKRIALLSTIRLSRVFIFTLLFFIISPIVSFANRTATTFRYPLNNGGWEITRDFGEWVSDMNGYHLGEDCFVTNGEELPVYAPADGTVKHNRSRTAYGRVVIIEHTLPDGSIVCSVLGHLRSEGISGVNTQVSKGDIVGYLSNDYNENGGYNFTHLHFGIRRGHFVDWVFYGYANNTDNWEKPGDFVALHSKECQEIAFGSSIEMRRPNEVSQGEQHLYCFDKVENQEYHISLQVYNGDADLYGHYVPDVSKDNQYPICQNADGILNENLQFTSTKDGRYFIGVYGKKSSEYQIAVCPPTPALSQPYALDSEINNGQIKFVWSQDLEATAYRIFISKSMDELELLANDSYYCPSCVDIEGQRIDNNFLSKSINAFDPNTTYYWRVRAGKTCAGSPLYEIKSFSTPAPPSELPFVRVFFI